VPRIELRLHRVAKLEVFSGSTPWDQRLRIISSMAITCSCIKSLKTFFESGAERATGGAIDATHARRSPPCRRFDLFVPCRLCKGCGRRKRVQSLSNSCYEF
jgi:hypothetical protein